MDRLKDSLGAVVRAMIPGVDYFGLYRARVVKQATALSGHMTVDVIPDDARIPGMSGIPLKLGLPSTTVTIAPGAYVLVGWEGGDPQRPQAALWDGGETTTKMVLNAVALFLGGEVGAEPPPKGITYLTAESVYLDAIVVGLQAALSALTLTPAAATLTAAQTAFHALAPTFLATKAKVV